MRIADQIRAAIERGDLRPGDRLPPLAQIASEFGCSRATVREALSTLRGQGLVEFQHGNGTYVRTASLDTWMEPLEAAMLLGHSDVLHLVETQSAILAGIVTAAAYRASDTDFGKLRQALFQLECAVPQGEEAISTELGFYLELGACCGNSILENALRVLLEAMRSSLRLLTPVLGPSKELCRQVFDCVVNGQVEASRDLLLSHGDKLRETVLSLYEQGLT
ncbi:FadR family transcriptional regulator [Alicyclobacillus sp. SO9]|nr:FadR family transcriptional regulator [Alicyclobacillus sp. SO9]